jgi:hypothetical protein
VKTIAAMFVAGAVMSSAIAATPPAGPFLCIVEQSTGFSFKEPSKSWQTVIFQPGEKLILKRIDNKLYEPMPGTRMPISGTWAVWKFGDDHWPLFVCKSEFSDVGVVWCDGSMGERFGFNASNNRFITDDLVGYIQPGLPGYIGVDGKQLPEGSNTPDISIGKCSAL